MKRNLLANMRRKAARKPDIEAFADEVRAIIGDEPFMVGIKGWCNGAQTEDRVQYFIWLTKREHHVPRDCGMMGKGACLLYLKALKEDESYGK